MVFDECGGREKNEVLIIMLEVKKGCLVSVWMWGREKMCFFGNFE